MDEKTTENIYLTDKTAGKASRIFYPLETCFSAESFNT